MPVDASLAGRAYPPGAPYEVGREKIREFALAVGETHPACTDLEAARAMGHPDLVAPPTFLCVLAQRATDQVVSDPDLGLDYARVVHRDQRFVLGRPICAGDLLSMTVHIDGLRSLAGSDVVALRMETVDGGGEWVATVFMSLVARGD